MALIAIALVGCARQATGPAHAAPDHPVHLRRNTRRRRRLHRPRSPRLRPTTHPQLDLL